MTKLLLIASVFLAANLAQAQQSFKVVKIQGKKAIVEMSDPSMVTLNQSYNVSDSSMPSSTGGKGGARNNALSMNFSFSSFNAKAPSLLPPPKPAPMGMVLCRCI